MAGKYWGSTYWSSSYWGNNYWGGAPISSGSYWGANYWASRYWADHYWAGLTYGTGNALGSISATLDAVTAQFLGVDVEYFDIQISIAPTWQVTQTGANVGSIAVTLDDAASAASGTFTASGANLGTLATQLADFTGALSGTHVAPHGNIGSVHANLDAVTASMLGSLTLTFTGSMAGRLEDVSSQLSGDVFGLGVRVVYVNGLVADVAARFQGTARALIAPENLNPDVFFYPSNYVICDRSGFKIRPEDLRTEWTGAKVRKQDWEARHPLDRIRAVTERPRPTPRPEQPDVFILSEVRADDL